MTLFVLLYLTASPGMSMSQDITTLMHPRVHATDTLSDQTGVSTALVALRHPELFSFDRNVVTVQLQLSSVIERGTSESRKQVDRLTAFPNLERLLTDAAGMIPIAILLPLFP